jgi:hypothetical protein
VTAHAELHAVARAALGRAVRAATSGDGVSSWELREAIAAHQDACQLAGRPVDGELVGRAERVLVRREACVADAERMTAAFDEAVA